MAAGQSKTCGHVVLLSVKYMRSNQKAAAVYKSCGCLTTMLLRSVSGMGLVIPGAFLPVKRLSDQKREVILSKSKHFDRLLLYR